MVEIGDRLEGIAVQIADALERQIESALRPSVACFPSLQLMRATARPADVFVCRPEDLKLFKHLIAPRVAAAVLSFCAIALPLQARAQDCRLVSFGEIPLSQAPDGTGQLAVTLDGKPETISLDFDKPFSGIARAKAMELNAPRVVPNIAVSELGHDFHSDAVSLGTLHLGAADIGNFQAFEYDNPKDFSGILLGMNVLRTFLPEFDVKQGVVRLFGKQHCADKLVYWAPEYLALKYNDADGRYLIDVKIDGRDGHATLAPGLAQSTISFADADASHLPRDGGGKLQSLEFGGVSLHNVAVTSSNLQLPQQYGQTSHMGNHRMLVPVNIKLGADVLKHLRYIMDFDTKTIYFTVG